jgi:hypothetical protein
LPSFSYRLYAVRNITAGEELTFQYIDVEPAAALRNEALKPYAVSCTCPACEDAPASDARRAAIVAFNPNVLMWAVNRELPDDWLIDKCLEQIDRLAIEGLQHLPAYFDATKAIMEVYIALGDATSASKWAAKAHKQVWAPDYAKTDFKPLLDPTNDAYEAHAGWRMRVGENAVAKMFQDFAALAGPGNVKALSGGYSLMMFPGQPPQK